MPRSAVASSRQRPCRLHRDPVRRLPVAGTYNAPYEDLVTANVVLVGGSKHAGLVFDSRRQADGERFTHRSGILHDSPAGAPGPRKLRTTVTINLKDTGTHPDS